MPVHDPHTRLGRRSRPRRSSRLLAVTAAVALALSGTALTAAPASAAPTGGASASPTAVPRHGVSTVTLSVDGENSAQSTPTDLVLVLDESGSISPSEFSQLTAFADDVVEAVADDGLFDHGGRVGVVGFASSAHPVLDLSASESAVRTALGSNPQSGGSTCIACGLDLARWMLGPVDPARNRVVVVVTDGNATTSGTEHAASLLQSSAEVFAVGVGDGVDQSTLATIASGSGSTGTFSAADFGALATLLEALVAAVVVPGATEPRLTVQMAPGWDLLPGTVTASLGAVGTSSADGFGWGASALGDELLTLTYQVRHEGAPCGPLPVQQVAYEDQEGAAATFPDVVVDVQCAAPVADAGPDLVVAEGASTLLDGTGSTDPDGVLTGATWGGADAAVGAITSASGLQATYAARDDGSDEVQLSVVDDNGLTGVDTALVQVQNVAPALSLTSCPVDPNAVGSTVGVTGAFSDPGTADTHTASIAWGDGTSTLLPGATSPVSGSHAYGAAGVYEIAMTVTDDDGGTATRTCGFVVVYDPSGGFVTGGGHIHSPAGAYPAAPDAAGRASFGFVSKYQRGATTPTGSTEFQFRAGGLTFHSGDYQWLVVSGNRAQYKGTGTVNGVAGHGFLLTAVDGSPDRLRMKIWRTSDGAAVYDNQMGSSDTAEPSTALTGGSIVVHRG